MSEEMVKLCAIQLARALDFMHSRGLVHQDRKPDNALLMDKECHTIKLCDFGLTETIGSIVTKMSHIIPYMSPELCALKRNQYLVITSSVDFWAFAVVFFVALTGNFPWKEAMAEDILYQVCKFWQKSDNLSSTSSLGEVHKRSPDDVQQILCSGPNLSNLCSFHPKLYSLYLENWRILPGGSDRQKVALKKLNLLSYRIRNSQSKVATTLENLNV